MSRASSAYELHIFCITQRRLGHGARQEILIHHYSPWKLQATVELLIANISSSFVKLITYFFLIFSCSKAFFFQNIFPLMVRNFLPISTLFIHSLFILIYSFAKFVLNFNSFSLSLVFIPLMN